MLTQKLNRHNRNKDDHFRPVIKSGLGSVYPVIDEQTGFIYHPSGFPIQYRPLRNRLHPPQADAGTGKLGLIFDSEKYFRPGLLLEVDIPLRNETAHFTGKVVLIQHCGDHYKIGVCLLRLEDAGRMRIVEQICHIETYLHQKKLWDGPYVINRERLAKEWIAKYASGIPGL